MPNDTFFGARTLGGAGPLGTGTDASRAFKGADDASDTFAGAARWSKASRATRRTHSVLDSIASPAAASTSANNSTGQRIPI